MSFYLKYSELIACISFLIPLIPGWVLFHKLSRELKFFIIILSVSFVFSAAAYYTGRNYIHNLQLYSLQYILQFILYMLLFRKLLSGRLSRLFIPVMTVLFTILVILNFKNIYNPATFDSYIPAFLSLSILLCCILFFNEQLDNPRIIFIYKTPWFWIITGLLLYFAGSFLILLTTNYLMYKNESFTWELWNLGEFFNLIKNLLITLGFFFIKSR